MSQGSHVCACELSDLSDATNSLGMRKSHVDLRALREKSRFASSITVMVSCCVFLCLSVTYFHDNLVQAVFRGFRPLLDRVLVERFAPEVVGARDCGVCMSGSLGWLCRKPRVGSSYQRRLKGRSTRPWSLPWDQAE